MGRINDFISQYLSVLHMPKIQPKDILEVIIISFLVYQIMVWIKNTRAWSLLKGIVVIVAFIAVAHIFQMTTIIWIVDNVLTIAITALIVVFQPELRRALEELGKKNLFASIIPFDTNRRSTGLFSDRTVNEIVKASFEMGKVKTGSLIVVQNTYPLVEYERTGIEVDALVSSQLLINIFEHNTPLHDGAVIISGDRVVSATCYLPLSDNMELSKELGTRHRAAVGISDITDSITVIVSEETGNVSVAYRGELSRGITPEELREKLMIIQNKTSDEKKRLWKGRSKSEKEADK